MIRSSHSRCRLPLLAAVLACGGGTSRDVGPAGQASAVAAIRAARDAQNEAIRAGDLDLAATYWTDDVSVRSGLGFFVSGRDPYREALGGDSTVTYERVPDRVVVSDAWTTAWEEGTWVGSARADGSPLASGRYAAQWVLVDGEWKIRGELFVSLSCAGDGCGWSLVEPVFSDGRAR